MVRFAKFSTTMTTAGFTQSKSDYSLFTHIQGPDSTFVLVYVAIFSSQELIPFIFKLKDFLAKQFYTLVNLNIFLELK